MKNTTLTEKQKKEIIDKVCPLIKQAESVACYGWRSFGSSGWIPDNPNQNPFLKYSLIEKMEKIVSEIVGTEVFRFPETYSHYYFCLPYEKGDKGNKIVVALDENGETKPCAWA